MKKQITILDTDKRNDAENMIQPVIMTLLTSTVNKMREVNAPKTKISVKINSAPALVLFVEKYELQADCAFNALIDLQKEFICLDAFNPFVNEFTYHNADLKFSDAPCIARLIFNAAAPVYAKTKAHELTFTIENEF